MVQVESYMSGKWCASTPPCPSVETLGVHDTAKVFSRHWETRIIDIDSSVILEEWQKVNGCLWTQGHDRCSLAPMTLLWLRRSP